MGLPASSGWTAVPQGSSVLACCLASTPLHCLFNVARQWTVFSWPYLLLLYESLVILPPFAWQQGSLTSILSWACQLALVGLRYLRVPQSCGVQGLRDGVALSGRVCVPLYVLDRNEGFSLNRAEVPWGSLVLCGSGPSRWGHPWGSSLRACIRTRSDRRLSWTLVYWFLRNEVTLGDWVCVPRYELDWNEGLTWLVLGFKFLRDGVTLLGSCLHFSYVLDRIEGTSCCWLLRPCLSWRMPFDSGLSPSGLICCYALSSSFVDF